MDLDLAKCQKNITLNLQKNQFIKHLKPDFFDERIFVLTPKGDIIDLQIDSTRIDFAYTIHSNMEIIQNGAHIIGKMVSLNTPLQTAI